MSDRLRALRESASEFKGRAFWVAIGCLICQMGLGLTYIRNGIAVDLIEGLDLTRAQLSGAATPQLIFQALASPLVGFLAVRLGASRVLAASATLFALVFFFFSRIESMAGLYVAIAGVGLCAAGMGDITVGHIVSQWFRKNRGLALGIAYAGSNLGGSVMVALVGSVAARTSWREGLLAVVPVALFVLLPTSLFLVREPGFGQGLRRADDGPAPDTQAALAGPRSPDDPGPDLDLKAALRTRSFWILTSSLFAFFYYFTGVLDHFVLFLTDSGLSKAEAIGSLSQAIGLGILSKILGGFLADRIPQERSIQAVFGLLAFSSLVLLALPSPVLLPVFVFSYGFSQASRDVVYPLVLGRCFGDRYLGEIYGAMTLTLFPGGALGPVLTALLRQELGSYEAAFGLFAVLNGLALVGTLLPARRAHGRHAGQQGRLGLGVLRDRVGERDPVPFGHLAAHRIQLSRSLEADRGGEPALTTEEREEAILFDRAETDVHLVAFLDLSGDRDPQIELIGPDIGHRREGLGLTAQQTSRDDLGLLDRARPVLEARPLRVAGVLPARAVSEGEDPFPTRCPVRITEHPVVDLEPRAVEPIGGRRSAHTHHDHVRGQRLAVRDLHPRDPALTLEAVDADAQSEDHALLAMLASDALTESRSEPSNERRRERLDDRHLEPLLPTGGRDLHADEASADDDDSRGLRHLVAKPMCIIQRAQLDHALEIAAEGQSPCPRAGRDHDRVALERRTVLERDERARGIERCRRHTELPVRLELLHAIPRERELFVFPAVDEELLRERRAVVGKPLFGAHDADPAFEALPA